MQTAQGRLDFQKYQEARAFGVALLQPEKGLLLIAQPGVVLCHLPGKIELQGARITLPADSILQRASVARLGIGLLKFLCDCSVPAGYEILTSVLDGRCVLPLREVCVGHVEMGRSISRINLQNLVPLCDGLIVLVLIIRPAYAAA